MGGRFTTTYTALTLRGARGPAAGISRAAAEVMQYGGEAPWKNSSDLYRSIDLIRHGDSPWKTHCIRYQGPCPPGTPPKWMTENYELYARDTRQVLRNQLATKEFKDKFNCTPYHQFDNKGQQVYSDLMSADWAWSQAVRTVFTFFAMLN
jgi:hypothetical protein